MSGPMLLAVGGRYARAAGVRRDRAGRPVPVPLEIEQTVDGTRRIIMDRLASVVCPLSSGRWAVGQWAREASLRCPDLVLELEDLWSSKVVDEYFALTGLAEFLKYLYLQASRGLFEEADLFFLYKDAVQRQWLERAAALSGLPVRVSGWVAREEALSAGLSHRGFEAKEGLTGVLDMGSSNCTLYLFQETAQLQWLGEEPYGGTKHLARLLAAELIPEHVQQGQVAAENLLEEIAALQQEREGGASDAPLDLYLPGAPMLKVMPAAVWDILKTQLALSSWNSPGAFVARCMRETGLQFSRLILVGGLAGLGFPAELFPVPVVVPGKPWQVELEGAAIAALTQFQVKNKYSSKELPKWEEERAVFQELCRKAGQEAGHWRQAAAEKDQQLKEIREQSIFKDRQVAALLAEVKELRAYVSEASLELEQGKAKAGKPKGFRYKQRPNEQGLMTEDLSSQLERLQKRNRRLEQKLREFRANKRGEINE